MKRGTKGVDLPDICLTLACGDYDINRGLLDGQVTPRGIHLAAVSMSSPERHWRMMRGMEFDVCEISMCSTLVMKAHNTHPLTAIPVFPHRRFRHGYIFVNAGAGIRTPKDLEGKRIGLRTWQTTAVHWIRGILQDEYSVDLSSMHFYTQDEEDIPVIWPVKGFHVERVPAGRNVDEMLCKGDLEAAFYPETLPSIVRENPLIKRLWDDPKAEEIRFYQKTGLFPLMHTVVFRNDVLERYPWAAVEILRAFRQSKELAFRRMLDPRNISLAWVQALVEEQKRVMGPDPWPYDLGESNRKHLELMVRWGVEFGLMPSPIEVEDFFFPPTLEVPPVYVS